MVTEITGIAWHPAREAILRSSMKFTSALSAAQRLFGALPDAAEALNKELAMGASDFKRSVFGFLDRVGFSEWFPENKEFGKKGVAAEKDTPRGTWKTATNKMCRGKALVGTLFGRKDPPWGLRFF